MCQHVHILVGLMPDRLDDKWINGHRMPFVGVGRLLSSKHGRFSMSMLVEGQMIPHDDIGFDLQMAVLPLILCLQ